jgi:hypothetical protein
MGNEKQMNESLDFSSLLFENFLGIALGEGSQGKLRTLSQLWKSIQ